MCGWLQSLSVLGVGCIVVHPVSPCQTLCTDCSFAHLLSLVAVQWMHHVHVCL